MGLFYAENYPLTNGNQNGLFAAEKLTKPILECPNESVYNECSFPIEMTQVQQTKNCKRNKFGRKNSTNTKKADAIPVKKDVDNEYFFSKIYNLNYLNYKNNNNSKIKEETPEIESRSNVTVKVPSFDSELAAPERFSPRANTPKPSETTLDNPRKFSLFTVLCCCQAEDSDEPTPVHREETPSTPIPIQSSETIELGNSVVSDYSVNLDESVYSIMQLKKYATRGQPSNFKQIIKTVTKNSYKNIITIFGAA